MFNGFKDFMKKREPENEDDPKKSKRGTIILLILVGIAVLNLIIRFFSGDVEYRSAMLQYIRENIHINRIDLSIMAVTLIILIIYKIKKNKK